jgi:hypothetical protein
MINSYLTVHLVEAILRAKRLHTTERARLVPTQCIGISFAELHVIDGTCRPERRKVDCSCSRFEFAVTTAIITTTTEHNRCITASS